MAIMATRSKLRERNIGILQYLFFKKFTIY